jgi:integrase
MKTDPKKRTGGVSTLGYPEIRNIQELLGHASLETTMIYTEVNIKNLRETESPMDALMSRDLDKKEENY